MADELTDGELRRQLLAYGEKNLGPITSTTRSIYLKKLNHLRAAERKKSKSPGRPETSRKLIGFSSDESEGEESAPVRRGGRRGRAAPARRAPTKTDTRPVLGRPGLRRRSAARDLTPEPPESAASVSIQASFHVEDNPDGFASTDTEEDDSPEMVSKSLNTSPFLDDSSFMNRTFTKQSPPGRQTRSSGANEDGSKIFSQSRDTPRSTTQNRRRSNLGRERTSLGRPSIKNTDTSVPQTNTGGNSSHTGNNIGNHLDAGDSYLSEEENIIQHGFKTKEDPGWYKCSQYVSLVLVILAAIFFTSLAILYMRMGTSDDDTGTGANWLLCADGHKPKCFGPSEADNARVMIIAIEDILSRRAGDHACGYATTERMSRGELTDALRSQRNLQHGDSSFDDALHIISLNPELNIRMYDKHGETSDFKSVMWLKSLDPSVSLWCRLVRSTSEVIFVLSLVATVSLGLVLGGGLLRYYWHKREEESKHVYELVEQIIDILKSHSDTCQSKPDAEPYLAIPHVRDMLIPPKQRKKMQVLWDKAVKFLSANESRVRVETQKISGEDYAVWRWLQVTTVPNGNKVWQGQAFGEHQKTNLNSLPYSPTPCLKIRNMFDPDIECEENWHVRIQDAILEKCGGKFGIVHVSVDKASREGCVFVKCISSEAAGHCYRSLHGWWFDGNLVTVKYLRLERYHERFPDAVHYNTQPLTPSNNKMLSLSQPFHRSFIETS